MRIGAGKRGEMRGTGVVRPVVGALRASGGYNPPLRQGISKKTVAGDCHV